MHRVRARTAILRVRSSLTRNLAASPISTTRRRSPIAPPMPVRARYADAVICGNLARRNHDYACLRAARQDACAKHRLLQAVPDGHGRLAGHGPARRRPQHRSLQRQQHGRRIRATVQAATLSIDSRSVKTSTSSYRDATLMGDQRPMPDREPGDAPAAAGTERPGGSRPGDQGRGAAAVRLLARSDGQHRALLLPGACCRRIAACW